MLGSLIATLLIVAAAAFVVQPLQPMRRMVLAAIIIVIALDLPFVKSKTALLGVFLGMVGLAIHVFLRRPTRASPRHLAIASALLLVTYFSVLALADLLNLDEQLAPRSFEANQSSFATRFTMWVIGFWGFTEKPFFGHGLGAYLSVYMDHFGRYGLAEGLTYYRLVSIPHNLFIHILSETGCSVWWSLWGHLYGSDYGFSVKTIIAGFWLPYCFPFYCIARNIPILLRARIIGRLVF